MRERNTNRLGVFPCALEVSNVFTSVPMGGALVGDARLNNESGGTPFKDQKIMVDSDVVIIDGPRGCLLVASAELGFHVTHSRETQESF